MRNAVLLALSTADAGELTAPFELGLLLDSSGSVTAEDFAARNASLARALRNPWLLPAIESGTRRLALGVYQYSGPAQVAESVPWQVIADAGDAKAAAADLAAISRQFAGGSDLDSALLITSILAQGNGVEGGATTLLVLGDGGTAATGVGRDFALGNGIETISAWVTGEAGDLAGHEAGVIGGDQGEALLFADPRDYEESLLALLFDYFQNPDNTAAAASAGLGQAVLGGGRAAFSDVNDRLLRLRGGAADPSPAPFRMKWPAGTKAVPEPVEPAIQWSAFGGIQGGWQRGAARQGSLFGLPVLTQAAHELRHESATAGVEVRFAGNWTLGSALIAHHGDIDLHLTGDGDDRAFGAAVYLSHQRALPWQGITVYGDLMAGWLGHDVELDRRVSAGIARGETDADTRILELNLGARRTDLAILHGPEIGLSLLRGGIDGFRESGAATAVHPATDFSSTLLRLGYHGTVRIEVAKRPLTLSAGTAWEHEFDGTVLGPQGSDLGSMARDTWVAQIAARAELTESLAVQLSFENRLAHESDSQLLKLGCEIRF
jgi:hypothetical protein